MDQEKKACKECIEAYAGTFFFHVEGNAPVFPAEVSLF
jgi:hypothetical protein